jgi:pilus assembly protein Flp/PilA
MSLLNNFHYLIQRMIADDQRGASLVEYSLLVALIAVVALIAIAAFGGSLSSEYSEIANSLP